MILSSKNVTFVTKTWVSSKTKILQERIFKDWCLVLAHNALIGSENWLVCLSYDQESIPNVLYFSGIFLYSEMKEIQGLTMPQLRVWMLPQKHGHSPKTNYLLIISLDISRLIFYSYSLFILLRNTVEKCKMHLQS